MITHNMTDRELILTLLRYKKYCKFVDKMMNDDFTGCVLYDKEESDLFECYLSKRDEAFDALVKGNRLGLECRVEELPK